jgi:hypothetical protein
MLLATALVNGVCPLILGHRGARIPGARSPGQLNFVPWHLIFVGPQCETCLMLSFWHLEFCDDCGIFGKVVYPCLDSFPASAVCHPLAFSSSFSKGVFALWLVRVLMHIRSAKVCDSIMTSYKGQPLNKCSCVLYVSSFCLGWKL